MLQESQINVNSTETKLLFDIRELLKEQNELLKSLQPKGKKEGK